MFVDTSFLIAGFDTRDPHHEEAKQLTQIVSGRRLVATNHIRGEGWTWFRRKRWHGKAVEFLDALAQSNSHVYVEFAPQTLEDEALRWLRQHDEREYSFVDATSFAYMRARGIEEALAFDGDFAAAGFTELRP
ncbi:MAG TPA: type II toxin-antitoxin system VapC family toxin [Solirubrobacterales bacterium]